MCICYADDTQETWLKTALATSAVGLQAISYDSILTCSVPQGSVIDPHKFVGYTEDIVETIEAFMVIHHLYADDMQL